MDQGLTAGRSAAEARNPACGWGMRVGGWKGRTVSLRDIGCTAQTKASRSGSALPNLGRRQPTSARTSRSTSRAVGDTPTARVMTSPCVCSAGATSSSFAAEVTRSPCHARRHTVPSPFGDGRLKAPIPALAANPAALDRSESVASWCSVARARHRRRPRAPRTRSHGQAWTVCRAARHTWRPCPGAQMRESAGSASRPEGWWCVA